MTGPELTKPFSLAQHLGPAGRSHVKKLYRRRNAAARNERGTHLVAVSPRFHHLPRVQLRASSDIACQSDVETELAHFLIVHDAASQKQVRTWAMSYLRLCCGQCFVLTRGKVNRMPHDCPRTEQPAKLIDICIVFGFRMHFVDNLQFFRIFGKMGLNERTSLFRQLAALFHHSFCAGKNEARTECILQPAVCGIVPLCTQCSALIERAVSELLLSTRPGTIDIHSHLPHRHPQTACLRSLKSYIGTFWIVRCIDYSRS